MGCRRRDGRMQQRAKIAAIAGTPEAALAGCRRLGHNNNLFRIGLGGDTTGDRTAMRLPRLMGTRSLTSRVTARMR